MAQTPALLALIRLSTNQTLMPVVWAERLPTCRELSAFPGPDSCGSLAGGCPGSQGSRPEPTAGGAQQRPHSVLPGSRALVPSVDLLSCQVTWHSGRCPVQSKSARLSSGGV